MTDASQENPKGRMGWTSWTLLVVFVAFAIFAGRMYLAHGMNFWCTGKGSCVLINCTPANPCVLGGKNYVAGSMCAAPGALCDAAWFEDCYCTTVIIIKKGAVPTLACQCR